MNHFYENITGWFTFPELYSMVVKRFPSGSRFLEIGTYEGRSFSYLGVEIVNSGKEIDLIGIDGFGWEGLEEKFLQNMKPLEGRYSILKGNSIELSHTFPNSHFDFIFIDANHSYEDVKKDIEAYLPKVKEGGILAGHDYNADWPGVCRAVDEIFGNKAHIQEMSWWVEV